MGMYNKLNPYQYHYLHFYTKHATKKTNKQPEFGLDVIPNICVTMAMTPSKVIVGGIISVMVQKKE
jgi:hypothetical protein